MARFAVVLMIVTVVLATIGINLAAAQSCPLSTTESMGRPAGTWPISLTMCRSIEDRTRLVPYTDDGLMCGQQARFQNLLYGAAQVYRPYLYIVPAADLTDRTRIRFYVHNDPMAIGSDLPDDTYVWVRYYASNALQHSMDYMIQPPGSNVSAYPMVYENILSYDYTLYLVELDVSTVDGTGYFVIYFELPGGVGGTTDKYYVSSVQVGDYYSYMPATCGMFNEIWPEAPPPPATWTPNPAHSPTPNGTPAPGYTPAASRTPGPTAPAATYPPVATVGAITWPTTQAEATPTPWPTYHINPLSLSDLNFPDVPAMTPIDMGIPTSPAGATQPAPTVVSGEPAQVVTAIAEVRDEWYEDWRTSQLAARVYTDTTGVGAPDALVSAISEDVGRPVSYAKALSVYMPNSAPYMAVLFALAGVVLFSTIAKPMIGVTKVLFELVRRLWEAIPLN